MPYWMIALYLAHVGAGLYWLMSSFLVALAKGQGAEAQFRPQMVAAGLTFALGLFLWRQMHAYGFGKMEAMLALGAACAVLAAGVQGVRVGGSLRKLRTGAISKDLAMHRIRQGHRQAAVLLAAALLTMVGSYHV
jgi:hypothetical protein